MKRAISLSSVVILSFLFISPAFAEIPREEIIQAELDCVADSFGKTNTVDWQDVCYRGNKQIQLAAARQDVIEGALERASDEPVIEEAAAEEPDYTEVEADPIMVREPASPLDLRHPEPDPLLGSNEPFYFIRHNDPLKKFEIGTELYNYEYTERIGVKDDGKFYGVFAAYTYRFGQNKDINSWKDIFSDNNKVNMVRLEGRFAGGEIDYEGSGTWNGIKDHVGEVRAILGYDIPVTTAARITPFAGFGYRYLHDDFSSVPARTIDGQAYYSGYDRESQYFYVPFGLEAEKDLSRGWSLTATAEYDLFVRGKQTSHLEDMRDDTGADPGYDALKNIQEDGYGVRASVRLTKSTDFLDFFIEPFFRYWHIDDSEIEFVTIQGALLCSGNLCSAGLEPDNETKEIGVKVGIRY